MLDSQENEEKNMTLTTSDFTSQLAEFDKIQETCKKLLATKHYQSLGESGIHAIMARAKALGIHPFEALNGGFTCIQGKVGMSTEMMAALVRQRGHSITKDPKSNSEICILHGKRADNGDSWTCSFSKEDAIAAGLWNGPTWKKYPSVMLYNRCMSMLFRQLFPDLSLGAGYVEDELKEITKSSEYSKTIDITEVEKVVPKTIDQSQATELEDLLAQTPEDYQKKLQGWLLKKGYSDTADIPQDLYHEIIAKLKLKISQESQSALTEEQKKEAVNE